MVSGFTVTCLAEPQRQTERQTGKQAGRQTDIQMPEKRDRQSGRQTDNQILKKKVLKKTDKQIDGGCRFHSGRPCRTTATNRQTDRQAGR